jgi:hypothetical protein
MIVWRTILGLIMASKWPAPQSQSACRFSMTDAKGSRSTQTNSREARSYARKSSPRFRKIGRCGRPPPTTMRPICALLRGRRRAQSQGLGGRAGVFQVPAAPKSDVRPGSTSPSHSRGLAGLAIPENGRPRDGTTSKAANLREIHGLCDEHGDVASASVLENWIDEAERRTWFLFEATRRSNS